MFFLYLALDLFFQLIFAWIGELLTTKEARGRQQIYDELASRSGISSALLVVREHLPSGKACLRMNIDATRVGNVARFINHACDGGNLSTVVVRSVGSMLPRLCFFASKDIKEGEELTFSYGEIRVRSKGLQCFCGSSPCFGILPAEHTWFFCCKCWLIQWFLFRSRSKNWEEVKRIAICSWAQSC